MKSTTLYLFLNIANLFSYIVLSNSKYINNFTSSNSNVRKEKNNDSIDFKDNIKNEEIFHSDSDTYNKNDKYYLIYVDNTYNMQEDKVLRKREKVLFVDSVIREINDLIIENKDTFQNQNKLNELIKNGHNLKKRKDNNESNLVFEIASINTVSILLSYLSYELEKTVKSLPGIRDIEPDRELKLKDPYSAISSEIGLKGDNIISFDEQEHNSYYDKDIFFNNEDIIIKKVKNETGWKEVEIRKSADLHLSLISQGKFDFYNHKRYDSDYYYPKSAGEGIDVYILDGDFNFFQNEYSNIDEREAKCLGIFRNGTLITTDSCSLPYDPHGELVSDIIGGLKHGVARRANIYGMAIEFDGEDGTTISKASFIKSLDYIRKNIPMRKNKSILNISLGEYFSVEKDAETINYLKETFRELNNNGVVIVASSGNNYENVIIKYNNTKYIRLPCVLDSVICVGGIDNYGYFSDPYLNLSDARKINYIDSKNYIRAPFSNYGENVNVLAPGFVNLEYINELNEKIEFIVYGTSFSSPLVAGVVATIMSEHSDIKFNSTSMISYLSDFALKDIINDAKGPNLFINNGKKSLYFHSSSNDDEDETEIIIYDDDDDDDEFPSYNGYSTSEE